MSNKTAAIYQLHIIPLGGADIYNQIGSTSIEVNNINRVYTFPVTDGELVEKRVESSGFIRATFTGRITDSSEVMEKDLQKVENLTAVAKLVYTSGDVKLLGTPASPVYLKRQKKGRYTFHEVSIDTDQPEFAKFIDHL